MKSWSDSSLENLNHWVLVVGIFLTVIGSATTVFGYFISNEISRRDKITDLQREANLIAANEAAEKANQMAEDARNLAEKSRLALQPRAISEEQRRVIYNTLKLYPGYIKISNSIGDDEGRNFKYELVSVL